MFVCFVLTEMLQASGRATGMFGEQPAGTTHVQNNSVSQPYNLPFAQRVSNIGVT